MRQNRRAFLEFFLIYFLSVAFLIVISGVFYYLQNRAQLLKNEQFSMIEYARALKTGEDLSRFSKDFSYTLPIKMKKHIDIKNFTVKGDKFVKYIPFSKHGDYFQVFKTTKSYKKKLFALKLKIILVQFVLLLLFALISYYLAKNALKPLNESIETLDKFAKDLIHDLNTPATSLKLNINLLKREECLKNSKALSRIKKSVDTISELHENLTILLQEGTFQLVKCDIFDIVEDVVQIQKEIYPSIRFIIKREKFTAKTNSKAMKQILQNIVSNSCKYNKKDGFVKIYKRDNSLFIEDSGIGIKEPEKIFERSYSANNGSGIGLDIVNRVAKSLDIDIKVFSNQNGSTFILTIS